MKVEVLYRNDPERPVKDPVLESGGRRFVFRLVRGDYCDPFGGQWFGPDFPVNVVRWQFKRLAVPFIAWKWSITALPLMLVSSACVAYGYFTEREWLGLVGATVGLAGLAACTALLRRAFYAGAKVYGADSLEYRAWLPSADVYEGSNAFCLSLRPFARIE